ncbi:hypothetical protein BAE44_0013656 [Dichanthelium oligosanthes]|uniref:Dirigent protein n=1 Tax=Dichanthelium oligosanthes TaxID=888268 RepID=A0A1E5VJN5_9POAL|nr:hypothetical protein BAE44_0013656 [Dichanthelium oligosanthes]
MGITKSLLLAPAALCFLVLAAQGTEAATVLAVVSGKAQCRNNPSRIISNAPLHVVINNGATVLGTGKTTGTGKFSVVMNVTSKDQLNSLASGGGKAVITAAPGACGGTGGTPSDAAAVATSLAAPVRPICSWLILGVNLDQLMIMLGAAVDGQLDASSSAVRADDAGAAGGLPVHKTPMDHEEASHLIQYHLSAAMKDGGGMIGKMGLVFLEPAGEFA